MKELKNNKDIIRLDDKVFEKVFDENQEHILYEVEELNKKCSSLFNKEQNIIEFKNDNFFDYVVYINEQKVSKENLRISLTEDIKQKVFELDTLLNQYISDKYKVNDVQNHIDIEEDIDDNIKLYRLFGQDFLMDNYLS